MNWLQLVVKDIYSKNVKSIRKTCLCFEEKQLTNKKPNAQNIG